MSNGLVSLCLDPGMPGVRSKEGSSVDNGWVNGSVQKIDKSCSTTSRRRSGCKCRGLEVMCFLYTRVSLYKHHVEYRLTNARAAPLYVWWYISLYSSSFTASSAPACSSIICTSGATEARRDLFFLRCCNPCIRIAAITTLESASLFLVSTVGSSG